MTDRERKFVAWVEQEYGPGIWPEMLATLRNIMSSRSRSRHVQEFEDDRLLRQVESEVEAEACLRRLAGLPWVRQVAVEALLSDDPLAHLIKRSRRGLLRRRQDSRSRRAR